MNDKLYKVWNDPKKKAIIVGVIAFNVGVGFGYFLGKRNKVEPYDFTTQLNSNFNVIELEELEEISKKKNENIVSYGENFIKSEIEESSEEITKVVIGENVNEESEQLITQSIFPEKDDDWNYPLEISKRNSGEPFIIHKDEFYADEHGYTQSSYTYYSGDNIMVDEEDAPVYNHEQVTGPLLFGHGSGDPNVVYIRNDQRKAEYEVLFDPGLYSVEVLGLEIENNQRVEDLKHSKNRKFRVE